jgi:hypothetical protein
MVLPAFLSLHKGGWFSNIRDKCPTGAKYAIGPMPKALQERDRVREAALLR